MYLKIADMNIKVMNKYPYIENMCKDYITQAGDVDFEITVSDADISAEKTEDAPPEYLETLAVYRKIAEKLSERDGFLMHGSVIRVRDRGIAFLAKSGVGKTTHTLYWKKLLGEECEIINGDKPLIRVYGGKAYAYGTPWNGKEGLSKNDVVHLTDVCFVNRSERDAIERCTDFLERLLTQVYIPKTQVGRTFDNLDKFARVVNFYNIYCTKSISAAKTVYSELFKD